MIKRKSRLLSNGNQVEIRFSKEDSHTPGLWESGQVIGKPIEKNGVVLVSVLLDSGCFVLSHPNKLIR
jgi:hypothetical protein